MAEDRPQDIVLKSARGGLNETDFPAALAPDQCAVANNVELFYATMGERRLGCAPIDLTGSGLTSDTTPLHLAERFINNNANDPEYWVLTTQDSPVSIEFARQYRGAWASVTPQDPGVPAFPNAYAIRSQSLNSKLFFAYPSQVDRMHVWDGARLRRAGLAQPNVPTVANTGSGSFVTTRYYRVRYIEEDASGQVLRRSEPSTMVTFSPSGSGSGALITKPVTIAEFETHWEVEASADGTFFFKIATVIVGTGTYTDSTNLTTTSYNVLGPASESVGTYLLQPSAKFVGADGNRLLLAGHTSDQTMKSRVSWSPVFADPGAGNDERLPLATGGDNYVDLDNYDGGEITGIGAVTFGTWYVFKWRSIYKLSRTGDITHAYDPLCVTKVRGALPGSIFSGLDELKRPCLYFLDPSVGPCSIGPGGLREIGGLQSTWRRIATTIDGVVCCGVYHTEKQQAIWWVPLDGATTPNYVLKLHVNNGFRQTVDGSLRGSWATADGTIAKATAACVWHELTIEEGVQRVRARPFIGVPEAYVGGAGSMIQRTDVGDTDNGDSYTATMTTAPLYVAGILNKWGAMTASVLASALSGVSLHVSCVRDLGLEVTSASAALDPAGTESYVVRALDDLRMSEAIAIQFSFGDTAGHTPTTLPQVLMGEISLGGLDHTGIGYRADGEYLVPEWEIGRIDWDNLPTGYIWELHMWSNVEKGTGESVTPRLRRTDGTLVYTGSAVSTHYTDAQIVAGSGHQVQQLTPETGLVSYVGYAVNASAATADTYCRMKLLPRKSS